jgi:hypothetical protein
MNLPLARVCLGQIVAFEDLSKGVAAEGIVITDCDRLEVVARCQPMSLLLGTQKALGCDPVIGLAAVVAGGGHHRHMEPEAFLETGAVVLDRIESDAGVGHALKNVILQRREIVVALGCIGQVGEGAPRRVLIGGRRLPVVNQRSTELAEHGNTDRKSLGQLERYLITRFLRIHVTAHGNRRMVRDPVRKVARALGRVVAAAGAVLAGIDVGRVRRLPTASGGQGQGEEEGSGKSLAA